MEVRYDKKADAIYVCLSDKLYAYGKDLDNERRVDYDANDKPIGVELLCVSTGVITDGLPDKAVIERALADRGISCKDSKRGKRGKDESNL